MNTKETKKLERIQICEQVIAYLNEKADRGFRADSKGIKKLFTAEWSHQYGIPQYKGVIDYLVLEWSNNPRMEKYLRPSTIFGPEKFPQYLDEARSLIMKARRKTRLTPFTTYIPVEKADSFSLTPFKEYDPNG